MRGESRDETFEVTCPTCGAKVVVRTADAERTNRARCPKGHEIPLARALG